MELYVTLPPGYPEHEPPIVGISTRKWLREIQEFVASRWESDEMIYDLYTWTLEKVEDLSPQRSSALEVEIDAETSYLSCANVVATLIYLDHMRNRKRYERYLRHFADENQIDCWAFHSIKESNKSKKNDNVDSRGIFVLLRGDQVSIASFLKQLRTENVDHDSKGKPCLERQMTVLETKSTQTKTYVTPGSRFESFCGKEGSDEMNRNWLSVLREIGVPEVEWPLPSNP